MTLTPHFIPTNQLSRIWKPKTGKEYFLSETDFPVNESTETFQLLLISDEPPKNGQRYLSEGQVWTRQNPDKEKIYSECKTVIAAYPPIQGIPDITDEDIAYIVANPGKPVQCEIDNNGLMQLIRLSDRKIEIEFGTECPHCHETIEGVAPIGNQPLFTKEDMEAAILEFTHHWIVNRGDSDNELPEFINEWLTTHRQK